MQTYPVDGRIVGVDIGEFTHRIYLDGKEVSSKSGWTGSSDHLVEIESTPGVFISLHIRIAPKWGGFSFSTTIIKNGVMIFGDGAILPSSKKTHLSSVAGCAAGCLLIIFLFVGMVLTTPSRMDHQKKLTRIFSEKNPLISDFGGDKVLKYAASMLTYKNHVVFSTLSNRSEVISYGFLGMVFVVDENKLDIK